MKSVSFIVTVCAMLQDTIAEPTVIDTAPAGQALGKGQRVAQVEWEGLARTEADELYHSVWWVHAPRMP